MTRSTVSPPDQAARDRIESALDETLFTEAGAGSGKTTALVARIVALVRAGEPMEHIAAITFTEKAALELRDRVRTALEDAITAEATDDVRRRYATAIDQVDGAAIGTLHSFAQRILREHPVEAGLPPTVDVMDEIASQVAFEERWSEFVNRLLADPAMERTVLLAIGLGIRFPYLQDIAADFGENWDLAHDRVALTEPEPPSPDARPLIAEIRAVVAAGDGCCADDDLLALQFPELAAWADRLEAAAGDELSVIEELRSPPALKPSVGRKDNWPGVDLVELRAAVKALPEGAAVALAPVRHASVRQLAAELARFTLDSAEERRRHGRLEFHDLLVLARELLCGANAASVRAALHARYRRILLDEFQDTDPIQIEIALRIAAPPDDDAPSWQKLEPVPGHLFVVGDPKQSIYRFRRADIASFLAARVALVADTPEVLHANFRTVEPVLSWVNEVFEQLVVATPNAQPSYQQLSATRPGIGGTGPAVLVLGATAHDDDPRADPLRSREAADVAAAVATIVADGWLVEDPDAGTGDAGDVGAAGWRPTRFGDITILLPTRMSLAPLESALDAAGIPYRAESSSLVYATPEIRALFLAARAVDDPTDGLAVASALRSSLFGCSDVDLYRWRMERGGSWNPTAPRPDRLPGSDADPVHEGISLLAALVDERSWCSPSELLARLVAERRVLELGVESGRPKDLWRRVRFVVDQARAWSESGGVGLRSYLEWARRQSAEGTRAAEVVLPESDDDAVRIMTIHAAKGLEFPITIVSGLSTKPNRPRGGGRVIWTKDSYEVQVGSRVTTDRFDQARQLDEQLDHYERIRLLYVACTRARDHLVVSLHRTREAPDDQQAATNAELLAWASAGASHEVLAPAVIAPESAAPPAAEPWPWADRAAWAAERRRALAGAERPRTVSATRLANPDAGGTLAALDPGLAKDQRDLELPPWQKGRYGTAVGRAVHAVLQTVDLATGDGLDDAAAAQAAAEGVLGRERIVADLARSALDSPTVKAAAAGPYHREVYVAAPIGGTLLEGYIDLLYRAPDGLVVVDYKTDHVPDDDALAARLAHYRRQGAAYALALSRVTQEAVARCVFVFCSPDGARERDVADLPAAIAEIAADLARPPPSGP